MSYGELKIDTITFTSAGVDTSVSVSGLVQNPTFTGNITTTGTISGDIIRGNEISGVTITGDTGNFTSGIFSTGTAAAPSIVFDGDPDTGFFSALTSGTTTQHVSYALSGVEVLRLTNESNDNRIQLNNFSSRVSEQVLIEDTGSTVVTIVGNNANGAEEGGAYLGLARTGAGSLNSYTALLSGNVLGKVQFRAANGVGNIFTGASIEARADRNTGSTSTPGNLAFFTTASGSTTPTERMHINCSGLVGVGTSTPSGALTHISQGTADAGTLRLSTNWSSVAPIILFERTGGAVAGELRYNDSLTAMQFGTTTTHNIHLMTSGANALTIDNAQRVGIGTTTPGDYYTEASNFVIANTAGNAGMSIVTATGNTGRLLFADGTSGDDEYRGYVEYLHSTDVLQIGANAETAIVIDSDQDVHISPNSTSLERLSILTGGGGGIQLNRNASGSPSSGDELGSIGFKGIESANSNSAAEASIRAVTFENHSGTTAGTNLIFDAKNTGVGPGSAPQPRLRIGGDGILDLYNDAQSVWGQFARQVQFGYGSPYKCLMLGGIETATYNSISLGYNVSNNNSGAFSGDGREVVVRNNTRIISPNATDDGFLPNIIFNLNGHGTSNFQNGIAFNADTAASNVLDDYEEDTWSPTIDSSSGTATFSWTTQSATYTKIGRLVVLSANITGIGWTGSPTGYLRISNAPFLKVSSHFPCGPVKVFNMNFGADSYNVVEFVSASSTDIMYLRTIINNSNGQDLPISTVSNGTGGLTFTISYFT